jgi:hypothetical protein
MSSWPRVEIDPVAQLRALSAALPHTVLGERVIDAPFDRVWSLVGDMEHGVPRYEEGIERVEIIARHGEQLELITHGRFGVHLSLDAVLRDGWCVMHSRLADIGMAAAPAADGSRTHFAHYEGSRLLGRIAHGFFRRKIDGDLDRIAALVERAQA